MRGTILGYDNLQAEGTISAEDGQRYRFAGTEWKSDAMRLREGSSVDFDVVDGVAREVYLDPNAVTMTRPGPSGREYPKSPIVAGILALFFGGLGVHKFYMGYNSEGVALLAATLISVLLSMILIGLIPLMIISVVVFVEAILYLTKNEAEFHRIYIEGHKPWF